jgi:chromosome partitioning protein
MKVVAVANAAGSAGKTTTVINLAAEAADRGAKTLVIDTDAQANATKWLNIDPDTIRLTTGDALLRRAAASETIITTSIGNLSLMPSDTTLDVDAFHFAAAVGANLRLKNIIPTLTSFDLVLIDCPGSTSPVTIAALAAADSILTVTKPELKEIEGLAKLETTIGEVKESLNPELRLAGIVPCAVPPPNQGSLYAESMELLRTTYKDLLTPPIRKSVGVSEAYAHRLPLRRLAPKLPVTQDYTQLYDWCKAHNITP